jgi:hypothetical protein
VHFILRGHPCFDSVSATLHHCCMNDNASDTSPRVGHNGVWQMLSLSSVSYGSRELLLTSLGSLVSGQRILNNALRTFYQEVKIMITPSKI